MPRLILGAPIAHRAWALPRWFQCLAAQTRRPDGLVFIHSGVVHDDTWRAVQLQAARHGFASALQHDEAPAHPRHDSERFHTLARLRNRLLHTARETMGAERFLSLDTDVMLEDPRTIERLEELVAGGECELASPVTWLHPAGEGSFAYNAGWWASGGTHGDPRRAWRRPAPDLIDWGESIPIDIPMAAWLCSERVLGECRYRWHESGEDLGFAQSLQAAQVRCLWDTALKCRHVWSEQAMREERLAA